MIYHYFPKSLFWILKNYVWKTNFKEWHWNRLMYKDVDDLKWFKNTMFIVLKSYFRQRNSTSEVHSFQEVSCVKWNITEDSGEATFISHSVRTNLFNCAHR